MVDQWWERGGLCYSLGSLTIGDRCVQELSEPFDAPLFIYDTKRALENYHRVASALRSNVADSEVLYAVKANRCPVLLGKLCSGNVAGVDVCSVDEARLALSAGFTQDQISFTSHGLTNDDISFLCNAPRIRVNIDTLQGIHSVGRAMRGRPVGIRVNTSKGYGGNETLVYSGSKTTKFGIYESDFASALSAVEQYSLRLETIHCHAGCGFLTANLLEVEETLSILGGFISRCANLTSVNIGGGLGVARQEDDVPLCLKNWGEIIGRNIGRTGLKVICEPGEYIVNDAGILVLRVVYDEIKNGSRFVGLNGGFNLAMEPLFYKLMCLPVVCKISDDLGTSATVVGNINEAHDVWADTILLQSLNPGEPIALLNSGSYAASMSSNHCLRGKHYELVL